jgi:hypothetical protein
MKNDDCAWKLPLRRFTGINHLKVLKLRNSMARHEERQRLLQTDLLGAITRIDHNFI